MLAFSVVGAAVLPPLSSTERLVPLEAEWKYLDDGSDQETSWIEPFPAYDDSGWSTGRAELGYGEGDESTVIRCGPRAPTCHKENFATAYFRHGFSVDAAARVAWVFGTLDSNDAAAVYLNGVEVFRDSNLAPDAGADDFALTASWGTRRFAIPPSLLRPGDNILAAEVHIWSDTDQEMSFDLELTSSVFRPRATGLEIQFNRPIRTDSLDASDLRVDGAEAVGVNATDPTTAVFELPALAGLGPHAATIEVGSIAPDDPDDTPLDAFQFEFNLNVEPQYYVNHPPRLQPGNAPLAPFPGSETDRVDILWQTRSAGVGTSDRFSVEYRPADGSGEWITVPFLNEPIDTGIEGRVIHSATITGLSYDTDYEYRVRHFRGSMLMRDFQHDFHTRLPAGSAKPFTFAAYGDSADLDNHIGFRHLNQRLIESDTAFTVLLGDAVYPTGSHPQSDGRFDPNVSPEPVEWTAGHVDYFSIGNHALLTDGGLPERQMFSSPVPVAGVNAPSQPPSTEPTETNYSFDYGNVHFVTYDTNSLYDADRLDGQMAWVEQDLAASDATWKIVFGHHPVAFAPDKPQRPGDNYYQQVVARMREAGADMLVYGHSHTYSWTQPLLGQVDGVATFVDDPDKQYDKGAGLVQLISGVAGRSLRPGSYSLPGQEPIAAGFTIETDPRSQVGYARFEVTPTELTVSYIAAHDGSVIDSFSIVDRGLPVVTIEATGTMATEQDRQPASITFTRTGDLAEELTVTYAVSGDAINGMDFETVSGQVVIPRNEATQTVVIAPIDDELLEGAETVSVTLVHGDGYLVGRRSHGTVTIADNDFLAGDDVAPAVDIIDLSPDPRPQAVDELTIEFTEPVVGFDLSDVQLVRGGQVVTLPAAATLSTKNNISWTLSGLADVTADAGTYLVRLVAAGSGILDFGGNALPRGAVEIWTNIRRPGDANSDGTFDQRDIVQILQANRYLTGLPATWAEGDWSGDGEFNPLDIIIALVQGHYLQGPYAAK